MLAKAKYAGQTCNICYQNSSNYNCIQCSFVICKNCKITIERLKLDYACGQCRKIKPWLEKDVNNCKVLKNKEYIETILKILLHFTITSLIFILSLAPTGIILIYIVRQLLEILYNTLHFGLTIYFFLIL